MTFVYRSVFLYCFLFRSLSNYSCNVFYKLFIIKGRTSVMEGSIILVPEQRFMVSLSPVRRTSSVPTLRLQRKVRVHLTSKLREPLIRFKSIERSVTGRVSTPRFRYTLGWSESKEKEQRTVWVDLRSLLPSENYV